MKDKIIQWANNESGIRTVILSGSQANGTADELSDYDISVFCESLDTYSENDLWLSKIGKVWVCVPEKVFCEGQTFPSRLVIFEGGTKVDFSFYPKNILEKLFFDSYQVLIDKDGMAQNLYKPLIPKKPSEEEFQSVQKEFWFEAYHVAKYLKREDLWLVKFRAGAVNEFLLKMIEWHAQAQRGWNFNPPHHGKSMQSWVDADTWKEVLKIFPHFDKEDSWRSLKYTIVLFRRLAIATAKDCNFQYLNDVDEHISKFIGSLRS